MFARAPDGGHRTPQVSDVVECIEHTEHIHAVLRGLLHEAIDDGIFVVPVTQQVLAAQQHLQSAIRQQFPELAQPLPRILVEEANARVERRATPTFHRPIPA